MLNQYIIGEFLNLNLEYEINTCGKDKYAKKELSPHIICN